MNDQCHPQPGAVASQDAAVIAELAEMAAALMRARQTVLPRRLLEPGPRPQELDLILDAAASAPDHGRLLPWRFIIVPRPARARLADAFSRALQERDPDATAAQLQQAHEKAFRAPFLMLVVVELHAGEVPIDRDERIVSAGCAVQNVLLMATALGYGSALTSGKALKSAPLRTLFRLGQGEQALCFVSIGTAEAMKRPRVRPRSQDYVSSLPPGDGENAAGPAAGKP